MATAPGAIEIDKPRADMQMEWECGTCVCVGASCAIECHTRHGTRMRRSHCTSPERVQDTLPDNSGTPTLACCSRSTPSGSTVRTISANARSLMPHLCTICAQRAGMIQQLPDIANQFWRRERDSNPRYTFWAYAPLAGECLRPLGHLSGQARDCTFQR